MKSPPVCFIAFNIYNAYSIYIYMNWCFKCIGRSSIFPPKFHKIVCIKWMKAYKNNLTTEKFTKKKKEFNKKSISSCWIE